MQLIKRLREKRKKTQGQLGKELGISQGALSQIETKDTLLSMKTFLKMIQLGYITKSNIYDITQELIEQRWSK